MTESHAEASAIGPQVFPLLVTVAPASDNYRVTISQDGTSVTYIDDPGTGPDDVSMDQLSQADLAERLAAHLVDRDLDAMWRVASIQPGPMRGVTGRWGRVPRPDLDPPREPTSQQCSDNAEVTIPGRPDTKARAAWFPQMGGYAARSVVTISDCFELWVWHDGAFPFSDTADPSMPNRRIGQPAHLHLCGADQWIDYFEQQKRWFDDEIGHEPYLWDLPEGVSRAEAFEVYKKAVEWGLWELDPGGLKIRTYDEQRRACTPIPCPSFAEWNPAAEMNRLQGATPLLTEIDEGLSAHYLVDGRGMITQGRERAPEGSRLHELVVDALRPMASPLRPAPPVARMPRVVSLPEGINADQAQEWINGCVRLGIIERGDGGTLFLASGMDLPS